MRDFVKTRLDIPLDHPSLFGCGIAERVQGLNTIHRAASWPKSIREVVEICLPNRFHEHLQQGLNCSVLQGGYP